MKNNQISLIPISIARLLLLAALVLIFASTVSQEMDFFTGHSVGIYSKLVKIFSTDIELNVPSFFSMLIMIFAALLLAFITILKRNQKAPYVWHWAILSLGFFFMAFDEIVSAHEKMVEPLRAFFGGENLGILYYAWVVPAIALILFLALFFIKFWLSLPTKAKFSFLIAGIVYLGGAIGMEMVGGDYCEIYGKDNLTYIMFTTIEESLEMTGIIFFIWSLLEYINDTYKEVGVSFSPISEDIRSSTNILAPLGNGVFQKRPENREVIV